MAFTSILTLALLLTGQSVESFIAAFGASVALSTRKTNTFAGNVIAFSATAVTVALILAVMTPKVLRTSLFAEGAYKSRVADAGAVTIVAGFV